MSDGKKTSVWLPGHVIEQRKALKAATGYTDGTLLELGLQPVQAEVDAARARGKNGIDCPHPSQYPNGRCRWCWALALAPAATASEIRAEQDEALKALIRRMGPAPSLYRIEKDLGVGPNRARRLRAAVQAETAPAVAFSG